MDLFLKEQDEYIIKEIAKNSNLITEATESGDSDFTETLVGKVIYYTYLSTISKQLVDVQPITNKIGYIYGLDILDKNGNIISGSGKVDEYDETLSGRTDELATLNQLGLKLNEKQVSVKERTTSLIYTNEIVKDFEIIDFSLSDEIIKATATEIAYGIDYDIVSTIINTANNNPNNNTFDWSYDPNTNITSYLHKLKIKIFENATRIAQDTKKGTANFILVSNTVASVISDLPGFKPIEVPEIGPISKIGKLDFLDVYINTFTDYDNLEIIIGKKPEGNMNAGIVYSPYNITVNKGFINADDFNINQVIMSRYAITQRENSTEFYNKLTITATNPFPF